MKPKVPKLKKGPSAAETGSTAEASAPLGGRTGAMITIALVALCTLAVIVLVGGRHWKIGVVDEWQWDYFQEPLPWPVAGPAFLTAVLLAAAVGFALHKRFTRPAHQALAVGLCLLLCLGVVFWLGDCTPDLNEYEVAPITASPWVSGYYGEAVRITDMRTYLKDYADRMMQLKVNEPYGHLADHPVGPILFHWWVNRAMESSSWLTRMFLPAESPDRESCRQFVESRGAVGRPVTDGQFAGIWASAFLFRLAYWLTLIPVYFLGRWAYSHEVGLLALAFTALIPSLHVFAPYIDQVFPVLAVCAFFAWARALKSHSVLFAVISAVCVVIGMLWTLAFLAVIALLGLLAALAAWQEIAQPGDDGQTLSLRKRLAHFAWLDWVIVCGAWIAAFLVSTLLPTLLLGYDVWEVWENCLSQHADFAVLFPRSYAAWVRFNPVEFALFTGVPVCLLMLVSAAEDVRLWLRDPRNKALSILPWALLGVLAALNFSGKNLGEVARLWMFLMPFAAVAAARALVEIDGRRGWVAAAVLLLSSFQLVAFRMTINGLGTM